MDKNIMFYGIAILVILSFIVIVWGGRDDTGTN